MMMVWGYAYEGRDRIALMPRPALFGYTTAPPLGLCNSSSGGGGRCPATIESDDVRSSSASGGSGGGGGRGCSLAGPTCAGRGSL
eukprot:6204680-Prymnesium_polylepis.3